MKKILVIENEWTVRQKIHGRIHGKTFGGYSKIDTQQAYQMIDEMFAVLADCELKDVWELETTVCQDEVRGKAFLEVGFLPNLDPKEFKHNDKLRVFVVKQKRKKSDD